jgi:hypothetical protein
MIKEQQTNKQTKSQATPLQSHHSRHCLRLQLGALREESVQVPQGSGREAPAFALLQCAVGFAPSLGVQLPRQARVGAEELGAEDLFMGLR